MYRVLFIILILIDIGCSSSGSTIVPAKVEEKDFTFTNSITKVEKLDDLILDYDEVTESKSYTNEEFQEFLKSNNFISDIPASIKESNFNYYLVNFVYIGCASTYETTNYAYNNNTIIISTSYRSYDIEDNVCDEEPKRTLIIYGINTE